MSESNKVAMQDLQNTVDKINTLARHLFMETYPKGKPDYMSDKEWNNISKPFKENK